MSLHTNLNLRRFQDELFDLINKYDFLPYESRLLAMELAVKSIQDLSNEAILEELKEEQEAEHAKGIPEDKLAELSE